MDKYLQYLEKWIVFMTHQSPLYDLTYFHQCNLSIDAQMIVLSSSVDVNSHFQSLFNFPCLRLNIIFLCMFSCSVLQVFCVSWYEEYLQQCKCKYASNVWSWSVCIDIRRSVSSFSYFFPARPQNKLFDTSLTSWIIVNMSWSLYWGRNMFTVE